jgi:hypothetical protein
MATERIRFPGDPVPGETGDPNSKPNIPLSASVQGVTQELLNKKDKEAEQPKDFRPKKALKDSDDEDDISEETEGPAYERERIGARIGVPVEEAAKVEVYEKALDTEQVVPCIFRSTVHLNHAGLMHHWNPGVHLVPLSIAGDKEAGQKMHWWLRHNRVKRTGAPQANPRLQPDDEDEEAA